MLVAPFNDLATVEGIVATHADELAAVIVEPFQRLIPPARLPAGPARDHAAHGILLVFDEVVTGFRLAYGGAQQYYGVVPDIACVGKIVGGGFPLAAVCASAELMQPFDPGQDGKGDFISQSGTLNGNPIAAVAGLATLAELRRPGADETFHGTGRRLMTGLADLAQRRASRPRWWASPCSSTSSSPASPSPTTGRCRRPTAPWPAPSPPS